MMEMMRAIRPAAIVVSTLLLVGCRHHALEAKATTPTNPAPVNQTATSSGLRAKPYSRVMVVPPSGTARAEFEQELNLLERSFLHRGITVISPAITGRVAAREQEGGVDTNVTQLSDVERALILAKKTNAQAILQVGSWKWSDGAARFFCGDEGSEQLNECSEQQFRSAYYTWALKNGRTMIFRGRLIDVESGEVMASIDLLQESLNNFPWASIGDGKTFEVPALDGDCRDKDTNVGRGCLEAESRTASQVIENVVEIVTQR